MMSMKTNKWRRLILNITLTILGAVLLSCKSETKRPVNEISVALGAPPNSIDPLRAVDATGMRLVSLTHQSLVRIGTDLTAKPELAKKWKIKDENYTFYINNKTKFSNGELIKCEHLIKSIKAYQGDKIPFRRAFKPIVKSECKNINDELVLQLKLEKASAKFLLSDLPVLKIIGPEGIGSGAFVLTDKAPTLYKLTPNPFYSKKIDYNLNLHFLKDDFSRFLKTYKGEVDIAPNSIPFEKVASFKGSKFKIVERSTLSTSYLLINFKHKKLQDINIRKAFYTGIDIPDLVKNRFDNHVTLAKSLLPPEHPYFSKDLLDMDHSNQKLRAKPGLITLKTSNSRQSIETGKIIAQKLRDLGVPIQVQSYEWGTFNRDVKSGNYDIALMKWVGVIDPDQYNVAFHSNEFPPGRNRGYYKNLEVDKLLDQARLATDLTKRNEIYQNVQNIVFNELAIIPLWHENQIHVIHPRIENYKVNPMGDFSSLIDLKVVEKENNE